MTKPSCIHKWQTTISKNSKSKGERYTTNAKCVNCGSTRTWNFVHDGKKK